MGRSGSVNHRAYGSIRKQLEAYTLKGGNRGRSNGVDHPRTSCFQEQAAKLDGGPMHRCILDFGLVLNADFHRSQRSSPPGMMHEKIIDAGA